VGHDIAAIALESPGVPDETVLERAFREERILDRDPCLAPTDRNPRIPKDATVLLATPTPERDTNSQLTPSI
jgi:hypothetical protein